MSIISISDFRKDIYKILKSVIKNNEPITITNRNEHDGAVLVSLEQWEDIHETLFLLSHKDARETIISELKQPIEEGVEINWRNGL